MLYDYGILVGKCAAVFKNLIYKIMRIKVFIAALVFIFNFFYAAFAQEETKGNYLFDINKGAKISGFGGPIFEFSTVENEFAHLIGGGGAVLLNTTLFIGGYGIGLVTDHRRDILEGDKLYKDARLEFGHGGLWFGYINHAPGMIHWGISSKFGWGDIVLQEDSENSNNNQDDIYKIASDKVFVIQPQAEIELNLTKWFKANVGVGYRFVTGINENVLDDHGKPLFKESDYNQPSVSLTLMFGGFIY